MSSDLYVFDDFSYHNSNPDFVSSNCDDLQFLTDPFSSFDDESHVQEFSSINQFDESILADNFVSGFLSSSPPTQKMENLSLYQTSTHHLQQLIDSSNGYEDFHELDSLEPKTEECHAEENMEKLIHRSFSSNSYDHVKSCFLLQQNSDKLLDSPLYNCQSMISPENKFFSSQIRRVCSTGDLQNSKPHLTSQRSFSSPLGSESSLMEESNFKIGRYSAEERKDRISKYRAKRTQRNFSKIIKYACRKTLADNRPRVRGRFARNEESCEVSKVACLTKAEEEDDELWFDGLHEEHEGMRGGGGGGGGGYMNMKSNNGECQFQCFNGYSS